ncbi:MAG: sugar-binding domain-containing protein [Ruminococcus sp.]
MNGQKCGTHKGGYVSFSVDITRYLFAGKNVITIHVEDDTCSHLIPSGKQSTHYESYSCYYTRTTGIWQTVWLEFVPDTHIIKTKYYGDINNGTITVFAELQGAGTFAVKASYKGKAMGEATVSSDGGTAVAVVKLAEKHLWQVGKGDLYDLALSYGEDQVTSYFGLRSIQLTDKKFLLNGKSVFQRLILDQGFYPDGIYTAPSDEELEKGYKTIPGNGFNGARLHGKVFEERFLYHCDRLGYIVWGEYPNWGLDHSYADSIYGILPEWLEEIDCDFNHPAIIGWCPFNETWDEKGRKQFDELLATVYKRNESKRIQPGPVLTPAEIIMCSPIFMICMIMNRIRRFLQSITKRLENQTGLISVRHLKNGRHIMENSLLCQRIWRHWLVFEQGCLGIWKYAGFTGSIHETSERAYRCFTG